jgi:hypothetical protein
MVGQYVLRKQSAMRSKERTEAKMNYAGPETPSIVGKPGRSYPG